MTIAVVELFTTGTRTTPTVHRIKGSDGYRLDKVARACITTRGVPHQKIRNRCIYRRNNIKIAMYIVEIADNSGGAVTTGTLTIPSSLLRRGTIKFCGVYHLGRQQCHRRSCVQQSFSHNTPFILILMQWTQQAKTRKSVRHPRARTRDKTN